MATTSDHPQSANGGDSSPSFGPSFRHWRSGKVYYAKDYGHKAWPFTKRK